ncbi:MAG: hypothetical protein MJZ84_07360 [Paludibacteraceae bacterium]|nr:hypothetical protein [Paludibacteraceae bacterium]
MANKIYTPSGFRKEIQRVLGYSQPTIRRALGGCDDTQAARRIRCYAERNLK